jgi:hypothetical protein
MTAEQLALKTASGFVALNIKTIEEWSAFVAKQRNLSNPEAILNRANELLALIERGNITPAEFKFWVSWTGVFNGASAMMLRKMGEELFKMLKAAYYNNGGR